MAKGWQTKGEAPVGANESREAPTASYDLGRDLGRAVAGTPVGRPQPVGDSKNVAELAIAPRPRKSGVHGRVRAVWEVQRASTCTREERKTLQDRSRRGKRV